MDSNKKCIISIYDNSIKEAPFNTIEVDRVEVEEPINLNDFGIEFASRLRAVCREKGYVFRFYSMSSVKGIDYEIVVNDHNNII